MTLRESGGLSKNVERMGVLSSEFLKNGEYDVLCFGISLQHLFAIKMFTTSLHQSTPVMSLLLSTQPKKVECLLASAFPQRFALIFRFPCVLRSKHIAENHISNISFNLNIRGIPSNRLRQSKDFHR